VRSYLTLTIDQVRAGGPPPATDADALVVDLDGRRAGPVTDAERAIVASWLQAGAATRPGNDAAPAVWVRISPGPLGHEHVRDLVGAGLRRVCVGHTESTVALDALDAVLSTVELEAGLPARSIMVSPVLESASGVLAAASIARAARVVGLQLAEAGLMDELGLDPSPDERELSWIRSQVVLASAAAGIAAPVGSPPVDGADLARLRSSSDALRRAGFGGRACVRADHVAVVNEVFGPR
jgi:citrate lyase subunit beta/citryl-CoA lyase